MMSVMLILRRILNFVSLVAPHVLCATNSVLRCLPCPPLQSVSDATLVHRCSLPLLKSRNSGVVLAVCTTHYYCSSRSGNTMNQIAKAMVRILRNRREIQFVVLDAIRSVINRAVVDVAQACAECQTVGTRPFAYSPWYVVCGMWYFQTMMSVAKSKGQSILRIFSTRYKFSD